MAKIYEQFGSAMNPLFDRLHLTKEFTSNIKDVDAVLTTLLPRVRNRVLNYGVGVEIETENCGMKTCPGWHVGEDGSLRNNGAEYKTTYGTRVFHLPIQLQNFQIIAEKFKYDFSERCSVHVHLDVRNLTVEQVQVMTILYTLLEDSLFQFSSPHRRSNVFCVPLLESGKLPSEDNFLQYIGHAEKYTAYNLAALRSFGTIEFRHMEGMADREHIFKWVFLLSLMLYYAEVHDLEEMKKLLSTLKTKSQYDVFLSDVFGDAAKWLKYTPNVIDSAVTDAKFFLFGR